MNSFAPPSARAVVVRFPTRRQRCVSVSKGGLGLVVVLGINPHPWTGFLIGDLGLLLGCTNLPAKLEKTC